MPDTGIRVTITDLETGESESQELDNDYLLICAGSRYLAHTNHFPKAGTSILTIKTDRTASETEGAEDPIAEARDQRAQASHDERFDALRDEAPDG